MAKKSVASAFACLALGALACGSAADVPGEETGTSQQAATLTLSCPGAWTLPVAFVTTETWDCPSVEVLSPGTPETPLATLGGELGLSWLGTKAADFLGLQNITPAMRAGTQPWCAYTLRPISDSPGPWTEVPSNMQSQLAQIPGAESVLPACVVDHGQGLPDIPPCPTCLCAMSSSCIHEVL
jgi:hypothetical protein